MVGYCTPPLSLFHSPILSAFLGHHLVGAPARLTYFLTVQPECAKRIRPLLRKLKKCRDPDRSDLVALQRARREQANKKEVKKSGPNDDDVFGPASDSNREAKRRKVSSAVGDPFGPALE